jgi:hypothetical protein
VNTNKALPILLLAILIYSTAGQAVGAPKESAAAPRTSGDPEVPATLVAKTVAWQVHWDQRAGMASKAPSTLTFKINTNSEAWIDGLKWIICFDDRNGESFPFYVERAPEEMKRDTLPSFARLAKETVKLPAYTDSFHKISAVKADMRKKLLDAFEQEACTGKMLAFFKDQTGQPVEKLRFWIAPVDLDFPVLLYTVEGAPYVGKVYFGTRSLKLLYAECNYITDPGSEAHDQGLKLIKAIKAEGTGFELKNEQLVPVER